MLSGGHLLRAAIVLLATLNPTDAATATSSSLLPTALAKVIPSCSETCLELFVFTSYSAASCPNLQDLDCLCTTNTTSGFTIGEAAVRCIASDCNNDPTEETTAYNVCSGVYGALPNTHATITATLAVPTSSLSMVSTSSASSTPSSFVTGILTATGSPTIPTSSPTSLATSSSTVNASPHAETTSANISSSKTNKGLTRPQIIGISAGGIGAVAVGFCILFCFYCVRRKKQHRRRSSDLTTFKTELPIRQSSNDPYNTPQLQNAAVRDGTGEQRSTTFVQEQAVPEKYWEYYGETDPEKIGVAISPRMQQGESPASTSSIATSQRTVSQLLPDKPSYSLFPAPLQPHPPQRRPDSTATVFEEDSTQDRPPDPRARMYAMERAAAFNPYYPPRPRQPDLYQGNVHDGQWTTSPEDIQPPTSIPPPQRSLTDAQMLRVPFAAGAPSSDYSTNASLPPSEPRTSTGAPAFSQPLFNRQRRSSANGRSSKYYSAGSDTTFESDYETEDITPPERSRGRQQSLSALSPVHEIDSPHFPQIKKSPIADIRYPNMPRPASVSRQAEVPSSPRADRFLNPQPERSPKSEDIFTSAASRRQSRNIINYPPPLASISDSSIRSRSESPSSLLAKRRGDRAADEMERAMHLNNIDPGKKKWRVVTEDGQQARPNISIRPALRRAQAEGIEMQPSRESAGVDSLLSPVWLPTLTPERRGDDLVLNVQRR